jgi:mono/diheme cytochrome c family protein
MIDRTHMTRIPAAALTVLMIFTGGQPLSFGQGRLGSSVWDGVYTPQQAERGAAAYRDACASCHGDALQGGGQAPPLVGADFTTNWNGMPLGDLFDKIQLTMPGDRPGQLSEEQNAQILAYILKSNQFPDGQQELPASGEALKGSRFEARPDGR